MNTAITDASRRGAGGAIQTLDANRSFARELARTFSARLGKALWLIFPDDAEVSPPWRETV